MSNTKHFFISGSIGVGKTTYINHLCKLMKGQCMIIKEYIDYDKNGEDMLTKWHQKEISCFEFQSYILDCFNKQLENQTSNILIWERHPLETIDIFCSQEDCLSKEEKLILKYKLIVLMETYHIPQSIENYRIYYINFFEDNHITKGFKYIMKYLHFYMNLSVIIYLGVDTLQFSNQIDNIIKRNRLVEKNFYTTQEGMDSLWKLNFEYHSYWCFFIKKCSELSLDLNEVDEMKLMYKNLLIESKRYTTSKPNAELIMSKYKENNKPFFGSGEWWKTQN